MQSMTYGTLPSREDFDAAIERECPDGYRITLSQSDSRAVDDFRLGDGTWTADELWTALNESLFPTYVLDEADAEVGTPYADYQTRMDLVSSIMTTLGFEWI